MSVYWAKFELKNNHLYRFDTRIYLKPILYPSDKDICTGAVVGKNPGSAKPYDNNSSSIQKIQLENDQLLPNIKSILVKAYQRAKKPIPRNSYVQILNLFYICDRNLDQALKKIDSHPNPIICGTEEKNFPFLWYVWGGDNKKLNFYKSRILNIKSDKYFYLDTNTKKVITVAPRLSDSARHTQGMQHDLIIPFISTIL
ncbi:MAG: hypothetical protein O2U61_01850 [Candidatus Bathyarchaeota archaeon]|nr:hypothetical protein [Candidatus Bathyarchaeota archaeon]